MAEVKLEIFDTGMEDKNGSVVYSQADTNWVTLPATSLRPEFNFIETKNDSKRKSTDGTTLAFEGNRVESMIPPRLTAVCFFDSNDTTDYKKVLDMCYTFGLKKLRGGLGTLGIMKEANTNGEVYVIIKAFQGNENLTNATNKVSITITLEVV